MEDVRCRTNRSNGSVPSSCENAIGALDDALLEIHNAIAGANLCFRNSDVQIQLRLVHVHANRLYSHG